MASGGGTTTDAEPKGGGTVELEGNTEETELEESFHARDSGLFLRMLLSPINVRAARKDGRFKVKEEYNTYRDRTAVMLLAFPVLLLGLKYQIWNGCFPALPVQVYQAWLLFFYTSLALRENILRVNGSDIRPWWVYHHYCAMVMALVSLTWGIQGHPLCVRKQGTKNDARTMQNDARLRLSIDGKRQHLRLRHTQIDPSRYSTTPLILLPDSFTLAVALWRSGAPTLRRSSKPTLSLNNIILRVGRPQLVVPVLALLTTAPPPSSGWPSSGDAHRLPQTPVLSSFPSASVLHLFVGSFRATASPKLRPMSFCRQGG